MINNSARCWEKNSRYITNRYIFYTPLNNLVLFSGRAFVHWNLASIYNGYDIRTGNSLSA